MCGICGIYNPGKGDDVRERVVRMRDTMQTRGPDAAGLHIDSQIALGHRRLAVIDLAPEANQPMYARDEQTIIIFNGEIYNYLELRDELRAAGHTFRTRSDTEVLLQGYDRWGLEGLLTRTNGMFAFALWDGRESRLHLVRDRLGQKPLFYYQSEGRVYFASDVKAISAGLPHELELDDAAVDQFFYAYAVPQSSSIYKGVRKVPPGHVISFDRSGFSSRAWWRLGPFGVGEWEPSNGELHDRIDETLRRSVNIRLRSDVPLGAFLSGGLDSGLVVALMAEEGKAPPRTFTIGFKEAGFTEAAGARLVAERYGTRHEEIVLEPDVRSDLLRIVWGYGEPFADPSAVPTFYVAQAARRHVTVALSGDGGDEAFGGYDRVTAMLGSEQLLNWCGPVAARSLGVLDQLAPLHPILRKTATLAAYQRIARMNDGWDRYALFPQSLKNFLYTDDFQARLAGSRGCEYVERLFGEAPGESPTDRLMWLDYHTLLPDDYLVKVDVASMLHSLEVRSPFLDYRLVELLASLPARRKLRLGSGKALLREISRRYLPEETRSRRKTGFDLPVAEWLRGDWSRLVRGLLLSDEACVQQYFKKDGLKTLLDRKPSPEKRESLQIWTLLIFELWLRLFRQKSLEPSDRLS